MVALDQIRILRQHTLQLDDCHIVVTLAAVLQRLIVFMDRLVNDVQLVFIRLKPAYVKVRRIILRHDIFADDPLAECGNHLADLIVNKTEQVSGVDVFFIKFQASLQTGHRSGKVADACLLKPLVVQQIGNPHHPFEDRDIRSAAAAVIYGR